MGNVYLTGQAVPQTFIAFDSDTLHSSFFIVKYNTSGVVLWAHGANGDAFGSSVVTDNSGIYVVGSYYYPELIFENDTIYNTGSQNMFIVKYSSTGAVLWAKSMGDSSFNNVQSITTNPTGVYVTGNYSSTVLHFASASFNSLGLMDIFILHYDENGNEIWAKSAGGNKNDFGYSITSDKFGNVYIAGSFGSTAINFDSNLLTNSTNTGNFDMFLVKLNSQVGINETTDATTLTLSPNPVSNLLTVSCQKATIKEIKIMNSLGQCMLTSTPLGGGREGLVDMSSLANGIYFVQLTDENKNVINKKIIKE